MPVLMIIAIIAALLTAIAAIVGRSGDEELAVAGKIVRNGAGVVALALVLFSSMTIVGTKQVGIVTSFGKPTGALSNGFHMVPPWTQIHEMDAAIQTDDHLDSNAERDGDGPHITVRILNQATADVNVSIRWRIRQEAADELFRDYRDFDNLRRSLVTRDLSATLNDVFASYNPFLSVTVAATEADAKKQSLSSLGEAVKERLDAMVGRQIEVLSVFIPIVHHDAKTQASLDAYQQELNKNRTLTQEKANAELQRDINNTLAESLSKSGGAVSYCLSIMKVMVDRGLTPPVGMCSFGAPPSVIINGAK